MKRPSEDRQAPKGEDRKPSMTSSAELRRRAALKRATPPFRVAQPRRTS